MSALKQSLAISSLPSSSSTTAGNSTKGSNDQPLSSPASNSIPGSPGSPSDIHQPTTFNLGKRYRPTPLPTPSVESSNIEPAFGRDELSTLTSVDNSSSNETNSAPSNASADAPLTAADSPLKKILVRRSTGKGFRVQEPEDNSSNPESTSCPSPSVLNSSSSASSDPTSLALNPDSTVPPEEETSEARKKIDSSKEKHKVLAAAAEDEIIAPPSLPPLEAEPTGPVEPELSPGWSPSTESESMASTVTPSPSEHSEPSELAAQVYPTEHTLTNSNIGTPEEEKPIKNYKRDMQAHTQRMISQFGGLNIRK
ncbi:hypothetical protein [Phaffia rhodozyma]|uniref:Uncharacterized protein n=1 Tax=Phaffia rhodozyma TaxID=264483 RepID=A0A0F7SWN5_PHARH|nr:hypothetical protein [Phaffia rhodozyma]